MVQRPFDTSDLAGMIDFWDRSEMAYASVGLWSQANRSAYFSARLTAVHNLSRRVRALIAE